mmetsp:Transcript_9767/g.18297  ORF Transcript_9767/g.18297 Transcript_9767/m.18297 type:complete len:84 (+) Transcript_9767:2077-2328(+)
MKPSGPINHYIGGFRVQSLRPSHTATRVDLYIVEQPVKDGTVLPNVDYTHNEHTMYAIPPKTYTSVAAAHTAACYPATPSSKS